MNTKIKKLSFNNNYIPIFQKKINKLKKKSYLKDSDKITHAEQEIFINIIFKILKNNMNINTNSKTNKSENILYTDIYNEALIKQCNLLNDMPYNIIKK